MKNNALIFSRLFSNITKYFIKTLIFYTFAVQKSEILIQRIQSIYLSLAGILGFAVGYIIDFIPNDLTDMFLLFLIGLLAFISLFCFKSRNVQRKINYINIIINVLLIGFMVYDLLNSSGGSTTLPEKGVELLVPVLLIILLAMANKYINKDEKLIKSVDRFR